MIIFIPGFVTSALHKVFIIVTFPGVILHEMAHKFFCDLYNVHVFDVKYFSVGKISGYVSHRADGSPRDMAMIALAPLLVNSTACFLFLLPILLPEYMGTSFASSSTWTDPFLGWIGFSCGAHALPSTPDLANIDKNAPRPLIWIKRLVQVFNWAGFLGAFLWMIVFSIVPLSILTMLCHLLK